MRTDTLVLIGAGGHARVVLDAITQSQPTRDVTVRDDDASRTGQALLGRSIHVPVFAPALGAVSFHVGIGDNRARRNVFERAVQGGGVPTTVAHPAAVCSAHAAIDAGAFIAALAVIGPGARVRRGVIVNHGAIIDHDCRVDEWAHIAPNATLGGGVSIGAGALVGAGAVVLPKRRVGAWAIVGAGAVVTDDVPDGATVVGVPARAHSGDRSATLD